MMKLLEDRILEMDTSSLQQLTKELVSHITYPSTNLEDVTGQNTFDLKQTQLILEYFQTTYDTSILQFIPSHAFVKYIL